MTDNTASLRPATRLVHGGTMRTPFGETSEALFLTQGFIYDTAEAAEARFKGEDPGFIYSRFSNPTVAMFEQRMALARGCRGGTRHGQRHGGRYGVAHGPGEGRRPCRCGESSFRFLPLYRRGPAAAFRRRVDAGRRRGPRSMARRHAARDQDAVPREPDEPDPRTRRHRGRGRDRARGRGDARGRQCLRDAAASEPLGARGGLRGLFGHETHRRPGTLSRWRDPGEPELHRHPRPQPAAPDRPRHVAVQRLGAAERARNASGAGLGPGHGRGTHRRRAGAASRGREGPLPGPRAIIRRPRSRAAR